MIIIMVKAVMIVIMMEVVMIVIMVEVVMIIKIMLMRNWLESLCQLL